MRFADAVLPLPPSVEVTLSVVLVFGPTVVPMTSTETVQLDPAATVPRARAMELEVGTAVTAPPHEPVTPFGVATISPLGSASVKPMPVSAVAFGLLIVKVRSVPPKSPIAAT